MKYPATIKQLIDREWLARSLGSDVGNVEATGPTREAALEALANEIRYRLEWCPCSSVADEFVELDVREEAPPPWRGTVF